MLAGYLPDADAVVDPAESFKDRQTSILDEVCFTSYQEEIIVQHLKQTTSEAKLAIIATGGGWCTIH